jgi:hypothetical protein
MNLNYCFENNQGKLVPKRIVRETAVEACWLLGGLHSECGEISTLDWAFRQLANTLKMA